MALAMAVLMVSLILVLALAVQEALDRTVVPLRNWDPRIEQSQKLPVPSAYLAPFAAKYVGASL